MVNIRIFTALVVFTTVLVVVFNFSSSSYTNMNDNTHMHHLLKQIFNYSFDQQNYSTPEHCHYPFYIFIYPLPTIFNTQLIPYIEIYVEKFTGFRANSSVGTPMFFKGTYNIMQFNTEILIHWLLTKHPCVTSDPEKASFFYLPVYAFYMHLISETKLQEPSISEPLKLLNNMLRNSSNVDEFFRYADRQTIFEREAMMQSQNRSTVAPQNISQLYLNLSVSKDIPSHLFSSQFTHTLPSSFKSYLYRNQLCDHIFVASRPFYGVDGPYIWQAGSGHGFRHNTIWLTVEVSPRYPVYKYLSPKLAKNIVIPYVVTGELHEAGDLIYRELQSRLDAVGTRKTHIKPCRIFCSQNFSQTFIREHFEGGYNNSFERPLLSYFAGSTISFRSHLKDLMSTMQRSVFKVISHHNSKLDKQLIFMYLKSKFCFVLPGDTHSSKRLFDIIASNCIPVIISEQWELPFADLPWNTFSLRFSNADLIQNKSIIRSALTLMPSKQILSMQINLYNNRHHFLYALEKQEYITQAGDAMDKIFQELSMRQQYAKTCQYYG